MRKSLLEHFPKGATAPRESLMTAQPVVSSDTLVKSASLLSQWKKAARAVAAVEMELGGVYLAARRSDREYPILAVRGISDVVGFKRDNAWTKYACRIAASAAYALVASGEILEPRAGEVSAPAQPRPAPGPARVTSSNSAVPPLDSLAEISKPAGDDPPAAVPVEISALAQEYEALRQRYVSGPLRTAKMTNVSDRMFRVAGEKRYSTDLAASLFRTGRDGYRLAALKIVESRSAADLLPLVLDAVEHSRSAFEQAAALRTLNALVGKLTAAQREQVRAAVTGQMSSGPGKFLTPAHKDRWQYAGQLLLKLRG